MIVYISSLFSDLIQSMLTLATELPRGVGRPSRRVTVINSMPWPIADQALVQELLGIVQQATRYHQLKKGVNEDDPAIPTRSYICKTKLIFNLCHSHQKCQSKRIRAHRNGRRHFSPGNN